LCKSAGKLFSANHHQNHKQENGLMKTRLIPNSGRVAGILFIAICSAWIAGCQPAAKLEKPPEAEKPLVLVGEVRAQHMETTLTLPASVESDELAMLMPKVEAYVEEVLVDIGDEVTAGQVLVRLEAPELRHKASEQQRLIGQLKADRKVLQAELDAAETQLQTFHAKVELEESERGRLQRLVESGAINRQRLEEAEFELKSANASLARHKNTVRVAAAELQKGEAEKYVAQAQFQQALAIVGYLEIKAPFAGIVATRNVDPGALVRPGASGKPLLTVAKVDKLRAIFFATMDTTSQLAVGNKVKYEADDAPDQLFEATLSRMAGTYDEKTRMIRVEADLNNDRDPATKRRPLRAGSYGKAIITTQSSTMPVVPQSALRRNAGGTSVVIVREGTCLVTPVEVAIEADDMAGISSGLQAGDHVVLQHPDALKDEQKLSENQYEVKPW
jgi:membrane fusion protein (multidrug efflux system)